MTEASETLLNCSFCGTHAKIFTHEYQGKTLCNVVCELGHFLWKEGYVIGSVKDGSALNEWNYRQFCIEQYNTRQHLSILRSEAAVEKAGIAIFDTIKHGNDAHMEWLLKHSFDAAQNAIGALVKLMTEGV